MSLLSVMVKELLKMMRGGKQQVTEAVTESITNSNIKSVGEFPKQMFDTEAVTESITNSKSETGMRFPKADALTKQMFDNAVERKRTENETIEEMFQRMFEADRQRRRQMQQGQEQEIKKEEEVKKVEKENAEERLTKVKRKIQYD